MPECNWEEIKTSVVFGGGTKEYISLWQYRHCTCVFLLGLEYMQRCSYKGKRLPCAMELLWNYAELKIITLYFCSLKICWIFFLNSSCQLSSLSFYLLFKLQSRERTAIWLLTKGRSTEPSSSESCSKGSPAWGEAAWKGFPVSEIPCTVQDRGNVLQWHFHGSLKWVNAFQCPS